MFTPGNPKITSVWLATKEQALKAATSTLEDVVALIVATDASGNTIRGSGFLFTSKMYILTAAHVIREAATIQVKFKQSNWIPADFVRADPAFDIALIELSGNYKDMTHNLEYLQLAPESGPGAVVFCAGYFNDQLQCSEGLMTHSSDIHTIVVSNLTDRGTSGGPATGIGLKNLYGMIREDYGIVHHRTSIVPAWDIENFLRADPTGPQMEGFRL
jgi:Trypsin-like peptidase domain